jgi:hypothetical protein
MNTTTLRDELGAMDFLRFTGACKVALDYLDGSLIGNSEDLGIGETQERVDAVRRLMERGVLARDELESVIVFVRLLEAMAEVVAGSLPKKQIRPTGPGNKNQH